MDGDITYEILNIKPFDIPVDTKDLNDLAVWPVEYVSIEEARKRLIDELEGEDGERWQGNILNARAILMLASKGSLKCDTPNVGCAKNAATPDS